MDLLVVDSRERLDPAGPLGGGRRVGAGQRAVRGRGLRCRRVGACRPRMIGASSAMCRQASRIESAAAWSWTVQVSDPIRTMAVREAESYRAPRSSRRVLGR